MNASQYQGLLHLSLGVGGFVILLLGLRALSGEKKGQAVKSDETAWHKKEKLRLVEIIEETADIKTFRFKRDGNRLFPRFSPGQFLSFQIGEEEKCLRSYSISGSTSNCETLQVSIKKLNNGKGSGWFHDCKVGNLVWVYPPSGHFTDAKLGDEPRVYIAGGIGITPVMSMALTHLDRSSACPISLFYAARSPRDLAFHGHLAYLSQRFPRFRYHPVVSAKDETWSGLDGHLSFAVLKEKGAVVAGSHYFFCGPPPMTEKIIGDLLANGVPAEHIHTEKFASPQAFDPEKIPHREAKVSYLGQQFDYSGKQTLLEFLETKDSAPAFACRVGVCGTCKAKVRGQVHCLTDAGLTLAEKRAGLILTCVAFPTSNVEFE